MASFVLLLLQSNGLESRVITKRGDFYRGHRESRWVGIGTLAAN
jgi:hypothetical protein